jgi:hypothetical protein
MPGAWYNLVEIVAMCHASWFASSVDLENNSKHATQEYMYDRVRLRDDNCQDRYVYGEYLGKWHLEFDVAEEQGCSTGTVRHIPVEQSRKRWFGRLRRKKGPIGKEEDDRVAEERELGDMQGV